VVSHWSVIWTCSGVSSVRSIGCVVVSHRSAVSDV